MSDCHWFEIIISNRNGKKNDDKCLGLWNKRWYSFKAWFDGHLTKRVKWKCCVLKFGSEAGLLHISQSQSPRCLWVWQPMASKLWHFRDPGEPITENVIRPLKRHLPVFFTNTTQTLAFSLPSLHPSALVLWPDRRAGERLFVSSSCKAQRLEWGAKPDLRLDARAASMLRLFSQGVICQSWWSLTCTHTVTHVLSFLLWSHTHKHVALWNPSSFSPALDLSSP